ncbi:hypothetical protein [Neisseria cinerea]|uniref:hypothetical protein n=1 Tax=Neisseria cinerea TaxID=483 RepID=UPI000D308FD8|nr:hypothetical protein [Neisseria cinerea]
MANETSKVNSPISVEDIQKIINDIQTRNKDRDWGKQFDELDKLLALMNQKYDFTVGDKLKWKRGFKNRKLPDYDQPVIVLDKLDEPIIVDDVEKGSTYYNEKLTIKVGLIQNGEFLTFYFDGNRFEPYEL